MTKQQNKCASSEDSDQTDLSRHCSYEERLSHFIPTECTAKTLIRLGGYLG